MGVRLRPKTVPTPCAHLFRMFSAEEALRVVLKVADRLPPATVPPIDAVGLVLVRDIRAPDPLPPYRFSVKGAGLPKKFVKPDSAQPEYHCGIVGWEFEMQQRPVVLLLKVKMRGLKIGPWTCSLISLAESSGELMSSRLLRVKSVNVLFELPATQQILPTGTSIQPIVILDVSSFPQNSSSDGTSISLHHEHAVKSNDSAYKQIEAASLEKDRVL